MSDPNNPFGNIPPHILAQLATVILPFLGANSIQQQPNSPPAVTINSAGATLPTTLGHAPLIAATGPSPTPTGSQPTSTAPTQLRGPPLSTQARNTSSVLPLISPYQSLRLAPSAPIQENQRFHPYSRPGPSTPLSQPTGPTGQQHRHLGFLNTRNANQQRLASASATLPRRVSLAARTPRAASSPAPGPNGPGRRTRGAAGQLPSMAQPTGFDLAIFEDVTNGVAMIKLRAKIYPPLTDEYSGNYIYLNHRDSFNQALLNNHLLFDIEIPIDTAVRNLFLQLSNLMSGSPFSYGFAQRSAHLLPQEASPVCLFRLNNRGRRRESTGHIYLVNFPILSDAITIRYLTQDTSRFVIPDISFEDGRFVLFFGIAGSTLTARISDGQRRTRVHNCISQRIYSCFPDDSPESQNQVEEVDTSGGESEDEGEVLELDSSDDNSDTVVAQIQEDLEVPANIPAPAIGLTRSNTASAAAVVERSLWSQPWVAPPEANNTINMSEADMDIFHLAQGGFRAPNFELKVPSTSELAELLILKICEAVDSDDFTELLSPRREFIITHPPGSGNEARHRPSLLSIGEGVEKEVLYLAFKSFQKAGARWFLPRAGGYSSITITHRLASSSRLKNLSVLGALAALLLINGIAPDPLSPLFIHYIIHSCKLDSIHPRFLKEWVPELHDLIAAWISKGPDEQDLAPFIGHFMTYHDIQIACLLDRDQVSHQALAAEMLHRSIVGPESSSHPEIQAFIKGFNLYCQRSGFSTSRIATIVSGGSEAFLNMVWTSQIKAFEDLESHLRFQPIAPLVLTSLNSPLAAHGAASFKALFIKFLSGTGVPCPPLFDEAKPHFNSIISLDDIDKPSFRAKHFCWAATGSPSIQVTSPGILISLCGPGDLDYAPTSLQGPMMAQGKVAFKTCTQQVKIPSSYLHQLALATYAEGRQHSSLQAAFDHWLLCEVLNGIAGHSIL